MTKIYIKNSRKRQEFFPITSVGRDDLKGIGYNTKKISDSTMRELADKMADAYLETDFWIAFMTRTYPISEHSETRPENSLSSMKVIETATRFLMPTMSRT